MSRENCLTVVVVQFVTRVVIYTILVLRADGGLKRLNDSQAELISRLRVWSRSIKMGYAGCFCSNAVPYLLGTNQQNNLGCHVLKFNTDLMVFYSRTTVRLIGNFERRLSEGLESCMKR